MFENLTPSDLAVSFEKAIKKREKKKTEKKDRFSYEKFNGSKVEKI